MTRRPRASCPERVEVGHRAHRGHGPIVLAEVVAALVASPPRPVERVVGTLPRCELRDEPDAVGPVAPPLTHPAWTTDIEVGREVTPAPVPQALRFDDAEQLALRGDRREPASRRSSQQPSERAHTEPPVRRGPQPVRRPVGTCPPISASSRWLRSAYRRAARSMAATWVATPGLARSTRGRSRNRSDVTRIIVAATTPARLVATRVCGHRTSVRRRADPGLPRLDAGPAVPHRRACMLCPHRPGQSRLCPHRPGQSTRGRVGT